MSQNDLTIYYPELFPHKRCAMRGKSIYVFQNGIKSGIEFGQATAADFSASVAGASCAVWAIPVICYRLRYVWLYLQLKLFLSG